MRMGLEAHPATVDSVLNIAKRRCHDQGITVQYCAHAEAPSTDGRSITLPMVPYPITMESLDLLYGQIIHETGHHLRYDAFKILNAAKPPVHLCALYNIVEDDGMEREQALKWRGDNKALAMSNDIAIGRVVKAWRGKTLDPTKDIRPIAALCVQQLSRLDWDTYSEFNITSLIASLPENVRSLIDELVNEDWIERMRKSRTPYETWDIAVDLAKRLYPENNQEEYEEIREAGKTGTKRDDKDSDMPDSQGKQSGTGSGSNSDQDGDSKSKMEEGEEGTEGRSSETIEVNWRDVVLSDHNEWNGPPKSRGMHVNWNDAEFDYHEVAIGNTSECNVVDLANYNPPSVDVNKIGDSYWHGISSWKDFMPTDAHNRQFANQVRRYIQSKARSTVDRDKLHGRLDKGALVKLGLPPIDGGEWNRRVFYDQRKHTMKDTAIFLLVDWSGSMIGKRMVHAVEASQRLIWTFDRVLKVPVACAAFTNRAIKPDIGYVKTFNARAPSPEEIAKRYAKWFHMSSGNNDGDSVNWAWNEILKRPESRKMLIVLSDGSPAECSRGDARACLDTVTKYIEKDKRVELYGIGIETDCVKRFYRNYAVIKDSHDINTTLFNILKRGDKA